MFKNYWKLATTLFIFFLIKLSILAQVPGNKTSESTSAKIDTKQLSFLDGKALYSKFCMSCHQVDGSGVPGMYPSLLNSDWVINDKTRFIKTVLNGQEGEIQVKTEYFNQTMPKADYLNDEQLAKILTFIRQKFNNLPDSISSKEIKSIRDTKP